MPYSYTITCHLSIFFIKFNVLSVAGNFLDLPVMVELLDLQGLFKW